MNLNLFFKGRERSPAPFQIHEQDRGKDQPNPQPDDHTDFFAKCENADQCGNHRFYRSQYRHTAGLLDLLQTSEIEQIGDGSRDQCEAKAGQQQHRADFSGHALPWLRKEQQEERGEGKIIGAGHIRIAAGSGKAPKDRREGLAQGRPQAKQQPNQRKLQAAELSAGDGEGTAGDIQGQRQAFPQRDFFMENEIREDRSENR